MPEPFSIIGLLAIGKAAITTWAAKEGADLVKDKVKGFAKDKSKEFGKNQLTQFRENAKLNLRQLDQSIPKALRLAYLQATLQVCALRSDELGTNVTSYSQYLKGKILRWQKRYDEPFGVIAQAEVQWLDGLHKWLRAEMTKAKEGKLPPLEITWQDFADLVQCEDEGDAETMRRRLTVHLVAELEQACPEIPDRFRSLLIEGWHQFDVHEQAQRQTWFDCFCVCFQQVLTKDPQARDLFQTKLLAGIAYQQQQIDFEQFAAALRRMNEQLAAQDISVYFDDLSSQLNVGLVALHDHLDEIAGKVGGVAVKIEESTTQVIKAQNEQTKTLLDAIRPVERTPEDEFSYYTSQALRMIRNKLSGVEISIPRFEIAQIEEQWQIGKPVLLLGESGTGKSGIAATLAKQAGKPVMNKNYLGGAVSALCRISMEQANLAVPKLLECLTDPATASTIAEPTFELIIKLAQANLVDSAFAIFEALPNPQPSPRAQKVEGELFGDYVFNTEAISLLPTGDYYEGQFWKPVLDELAGLDLKRLVTLLEKQLIKALRIEAETRGWSDENLGYLFGRQAIEDTGQDLSDDYKDFLVERLRDFLKKLAENQPNEAVVFIDTYLSGGYEILKRLGIYLLSQFPKQYLDRAGDILLNAENMDEVRIHHEYFKLLEYGYPHLESADQSRLEEMITAGPDPEKLAKVATWADKERGQDPVEYARTYSECWKRDRLWMIRDHLQGEAAAILQNLTKEFGEPEHPDFTSWSTGAYFVATISPANADEIGAMPLQELLKYLREWKPGDRMHRFEEERYGALGQVVAQVVFSDYEKYGDHLGVIARLNPEYATSFINHPTSSAFPPDEMLRIKMSLAEELLADEPIRTSNSRGYEGGWIGFRFAVVNYLGKFFDKDSPPIPADELSRVRDLLILLTHDPDPMPDADQPSEGWFGHKDPATVAINHVRPEALSTLIRYASYKARQEMADDHRGFGPKRLELEVKQTLTGKVVYLLDRSTALHSIFGKYFNLLCWLDWEWAVEHLNTMFPEGDDEMSVGFFAAAWDSFVVFNPQIYTPVFSLLRSKYERAIELHKQGFNTQTHLDPVGHFTSHLVVEYLYADYTLDSPKGESSMLARFFKETTAKSRATAVQSAVEVFINVLKNEENGDRFWPRMRSLWQWRLEEAASRNHPSDFDGEMQSFSRILRSAAERESAASVWPLLEGMLHYIARSERRDIVWWNFEQYLVLEVKRNPVRAIQIFRLMHDQIESPHFHYTDEARKIIEAGAQSSESRHETLLLIEQIARSGNYSFTHVDDQYVGGEIR